LEGSRRKAVSHNVTRRVPHDDDDDVYGHYDYDFGAVATVF
jgi:hypothetical protein